MKSFPFLPAVINIHGSAERLKRFMYFLNLPVFCFIFSLFLFLMHSLWSVLGDVWCTVTERLHMGFVWFFKIMAHVFHQSNWTRCSQQTRQTISQQISLAFFNLIWLTCVHSWFRQLKPVCYCSASQAWSFGGHHQFVIIRIRGQILSVLYLSGKHSLIPVTTVEGYWVSYQE